MADTASAPGTRSVSLRRFSVGKKVAPICWVIPPASPSCAPRSRGTSARATPLPRHRGVRLERKDA
jgi:hypothetical protein